MTEDQIKQLQRCREFGLKLYSKLPGNRAYALDEESKDAIACLFGVYRDASGSLNDEEELTAMFKQIGEVVPGVFQEKPDEPLQPPKIPTDPVSGQPLPNPWAKGTENLAAQGYVSKNHPELAAYFKQSATDQWGFAIDWQEKEKARERARVIHYTSDDHEANPFVTGNKKGQDDLVRADPEKAKVFQREAQSLEFPWQVGSENLTLRSRMLREIPHIYELCEKSARIHEKWNAQRLIDLKRAEAQAKADRERIEKQLTREQNQPRPIGRIA